MSELRNIPPIWTAIAQWGAVALVQMLLPKKLSAWKNFLALLPFLVVQCVWLQLVGGLDGMPFNLGMTMSAALTLIPFALLGRHLSLKTRLYHCARAFMLSGFSVSIAWQIYIYVAGQWAVLNTMPGEIGCMAAMLGILLMVFGILERKQEQAESELEVGVGACVTSVAVAFVIYILSSISYAPIHTPFSGSTEADAFNLRTWIYLCGVAMLYANHIQLCDTHARQELLKMQSILEMQRANYVNSREAVELVNRKYHDLKHQIAVLRSTISSDDKLRALDQMEQEIRDYETENKTGNQVLDIVLTGKAITCKNNGIELTIVADGQALSFMDWVDISNMFGNMLDNAIEAVMALPASRRLIHLSVARQRGFVCVMMENCYDETSVVDLREGLPISLHKNRNFHGFGLKSIIATAKKYNGTASYQREDGWFRLRVLMPAENIAKM